eukprot:753832-Hanusia_phi.AAC.1
MIYKLERVVSLILRLQGEACACEHDAALQAVLVEALYAIPARRPRPTRASLEAWQASGGQAASRSKQATCGRNMNVVGRRRSGLKLLAL